MGIDNVALKFLKYCKRDNIKFGYTLTVGRQQLDVESNIISKILNTNKSYKGFCEQLLIDNFGSTNVESLDIDEYENASQIFDLNKPVPKDQYQKYDSIIDCGTTQHIFNAPQALDNYTKMIKLGGKIIHCLPSNNFMNFGFWQFSPNLFHSYYSKERGYGETEIYLAIENGSKFYKVNSFNTAIIYSGKSTTLLVKTRYLGKNLGKASENIQQKIYQDIWANHQNKNDNGKEKNKNNLRGILRFIPGMAFLGYLVGSCIKYTPKSKISLEQVTLD
jgi:hypothetical protein